MSFREIAGTGMAYSLGARVGLMAEWRSGKVSD